MPQVGQAEPMQSTGIHALASLTVQLTVNPQKHQLEMLRISSSHQNE